ncbi:MULTISPECIES: LuxR C-terminal-related transcriptional regulator [unclassified Kribbella]|uniref:LuxR C-terminal-related transcriptional regulator n=1 Tax=unclassified Kribbella TaxID=2644121 RepID=UPI00301B0745
MAASDFERAADLLELALPAMRRDRQEATMIGWLKRLPDELLRERPGLSLDYSGALLSFGSVDDAESRLQDAAQDEALGGWIAIYRAGLALMRADNATTVTQGRKALELLPDDDHLGHGAATGLLGLASWSQGDLEAAHTAYTDCMASLIRVGHLSDALGCSITLADIAITQGRLREAMRVYERALELGQDGPPLRGTADMYVGMSGLHRERNELPAALELLHRSDRLGDAMGLPQNPWRRRVAMARIREAEGDLAGAVELLDDAERRYFGDFSPEVRPVSAMRARVWIRQGKVEDALAWARDRGLPGDLVYLREFEHITLARALLAGGSLDEAVELLQGLLRDAETGGRIGSVIEILVLQALAQRGDVPAALVPLSRALTLASPEGYVRVFVDDGTAMLPLLKAAAKQGIPVGHLVSALTGAVVPSQGVPDALSERELEVLRLLGSELAGPDIARELTVSLNTLRTHTKNIYLKLGVNSRRAAVRRAGELGLLARTH